MTVTSLIRMADGPVHGNKELSQYLSTANKTETRRLCLLSNGAEDWPFKRCACEANCAAYIMQISKNTAIKINARMTGEVSARADRDTTPITCHFIGESGDVNPSLVRSPARSTAVPVLNQSLFYAIFIITYYNNTIFDCCIV